MRQTGRKGWALTGKRERNEMIDSKSFWGQAQIADGWDHMLKFGNDKKELILLTKYLGYTLGKSA